MWTSRMRKSCRSASRRKAEDISNGGGEKKNGDGEKKNRGGEKNDRPRKAITDPKRKRAEDNNNATRKLKRLRRRSKKKKDWRLKAMAKPNPDADSGTLETVRLYKRAQRRANENTPLVPTPAGKARGITAIDEVTEGFTGRFVSTATLPVQEMFPVDDRSASLSFSIDEIMQELTHQDATKAYGNDGVHIRLMKTLATTSFLQILAALYNSCLRNSKTPRS
ncbi:unnamed protein product [Zymoseptoria tritici ST99CH_3D7]|uniref:Uncharacterized protein n=1 Tax=Zymoseptoria tritici (strain ST99CH_3D7) TaxID=1276538 RepID=A0A1X7S3J6_ZYMT9|nr:unnamed protein product [Zymoseptoria tritici ST99CH_3D7]